MSPGVQSLVAGLPAALAGLTAAVGRLTETGNDPFSVDQWEHLELIQQAVAQLEDQLRVLCSPEFSSEPDPAQVSTTDVVRLCHELVEQQGSLLEVGAEAGVARLTLAVEAEPALPRLQVNPTTLRRVLDNLLANAVAATDTGRVTISLRKRAEVLELTVTDTGWGISPDELPYVFEPLFRGTRGPRRAGRGLGLFVSKRLIEGLGGSIAVQSGQGGGTRVTVVVPLTPGAAAAVGRLEAPTALLLAGRSHDLRRPLSALIGLAQVIADGLTGPLSPSRRGAAREVVRRGSALLERIDALLDAALQRDETSR